MALVDYFVFLIYRFIAIPTALFFLYLFRNFLPSKMQEMISDRDDKNLQALSSRPIWIHAASGEIEYAKSLIRQLKAELPQVPIMVTFFSPSAKKLIAQFPGLDLVRALPWDTPKEAQKFLNFYQPRVALFARTDVWPEMAFELKKKKIPSALFSATFSENSTRSRFISSSLTRSALNSLNRIFCVSQVDAENIEELGVGTPLEISGDTRFDQVIYRGKNPHPVKDQLRPSGAGKILIAGSTWPQDEEVLFESLAYWFQQGGKLILAPHETSKAHLDKLAGQILEKGFRMIRYSEAEKWDQEDILLIDQVGHLHELYSWADVAFVGGSFKDKVHSVMEPLSAGLQVMVGPYHENNREALQFQYLILEPGLFAVQVVQNAPEIEFVMSKVLSSQTRSHPQILQKVESSSGSTARLITWIRECLRV